METCFGFVVMGSTPIVLGSSNSLHSYYAVLEPKLDELVSKSCEIEPVPLKVSITPEYTECEKIYSSAAKRKLSSTYIVALPFKKGLALLGDSYQWSLKSLHFLKRMELGTSIRRPICHFLHDKIIGVGGRLQNANIKLDLKHPYLIYKKNHFVALLIDHCNKSNHHTVPNLVASILRQKYCILSSSRNVIR